MLQSTYSEAMDRLLKILKISALLVLVLALVGLSMPTLKGVFVIIHFTSTLRAWGLLQILFLSLAVAAQVLLCRVSAFVSGVVAKSELFSPGYMPATRPLRC
jgi:hypothetical protein